MNEPNLDLIGKLVAMAKGGTPNERATAEKMLRALCEKHGLDFDGVMADEERFQEVQLTLNHHRDRVIALQIILKYGIHDREHDTIYEVSRKGQAHPFAMKWTTTQDRYIETLNAYDILSPLYERERKKVISDAELAFVYKHDLFPRFPSDKVKSSDMKDVMRALNIAKNMEDANILQRLTSGNKQLN